MDVSASIVIHNSRPEEVHRAIECLLRSNVSPVYIIENSPGSLLKDVEDKYEGVIYQHVENRGFGAGHNVAIRRVLGDISKKDGYHIVMNADVWWEGDAVAPLLSYLEEHPDVGMAMPRVVYPDGVLQYACRMLPTPFDLFAKRFLPAGISRKRMERYLLAAHDHTKALNCPYLLGSFLLFRNKALLDVGIFDERFFMYPEDIDITRRVHERWKTLFLPVSTIVHAHAAQSRRNMRLLWVHIVNMCRYFNKWGWFRDSKRRKYNKRLLSSVVSQDPAIRPPGRG